MCQATGSQNPGWSQNKRIQGLSPGQGCRSRKSRIFRASLKAPVCSGVKYAVMCNNDQPNWAVISCLVFDFVLYIVIIIAEHAGAWLFAEWPWYDFSLCTITYSCRPSYGFLGGEMVMCMIHITWVFLGNALCNNANLVTPCLQAETTALDLSIISDNLALPCPPCRVHFRR